MDRDPNRIGLHARLRGQPDDCITGNWEPYADADGNVIELQDAIDITVHNLGTSSTSVPIEQTKAGTTQANFLITLQNNSAATDSGSLEIYVKWHD